MLAPSCDRRNEVTADSPRLRVAKADLLDAGSPLIRTGSPPLQIILIYWTDGYFLWNSVKK